jgi:hypothetical protein
MMDAFLVLIIILVILLAMLGLSKLVAWLL